MDALQQRVEGKPAIVGTDNLAIEDELRRLQCADGLDKLRVIARQRLTGLRLQLDLVAVAEREAAEAVPFRLVLPFRSDRDLIDRQRLHGRKRRAELKRHG